MKIKELEIENYKGFEKAKIQFHPQVNVFIGSNASGKSTLLLAITKAFYRLSRHYSGEIKQHELLKLSSSEINYKHTSSSIRITIADFLDFEKEIACYINISPPSENKNVTKIFTIAEPDSEFTRWFDNLTGFPTTIPIFKFYPANRGAIKYVNDINFGILKISQLEAWTNIYQDDISYSKFFNWFHENETNELRLQRDAQDFSIENPAIKDVRKALVKAFEIIGYEQFLIKTKQISRQGSSKLIPVLVLENSQTKQDEYLDQKSDGEKAIITLIADIAYNLSLAKDFVFNDDVLQSSGVVLIDEIETHLHPNWQRKIIPMLTTIFPQIQFFIATHSPEVVSSVSSESVFACDKFMIRKIQLKTKGEDTNSLLKYIFGSTERPGEYIVLLQEFETLMEKNAEYTKLEHIIQKIKQIDSQDDANGISNLIDELNIQLSAYKFDREHENDN